MNEHKIFLLALVPSHARMADVPSTLGDLKLRAGKTLSNRTEGTLIKVATRACGFYQLPTVSPLTKSSGTGDRRFASTAQGAITPLSGDLRSGSGDM